MRERGVVWGSEGERGAVGWCERDGGCRVVRKWFIKEGFGEGGG